MGRPPGGRISTSSSAPPLQSSRSCSPSTRTRPPAAASVGIGGSGARAAITPSQVPSGSGSRAPMCGRSARTARSTSIGLRVKSSVRSRPSIFGA